MERVGDAAFGPVDRIGQLTMRNLDIADSRARLEQYAAPGIIGGATGELVGRVTAGATRTRSPSTANAAQRRGRSSSPTPTDAASEGAAFDFGTD